MMSLYRHRERQGKLVAATLLVVVLFVLDMLSGGTVRGLAQQGAAALSRSVGGMYHAISHNGYFSTRAELEAQIRDLSDQVRQYQAQLAFSAAVQEENNRLHELDHVVAHISGVTAPVVSSVIASPYGTFLIGGGSLDGISRGSLVLAGDGSGQNGFAVGVITDVSAHTATVTEAFAPSAKLDVIVHGSSAVLEGSGGGNAYISLPRDAAVSVGDTVVAPALGGHAVGIVGSIASSSAEASQDIYVRVPVNLGALQFVYVVAR